MTRRFRTAVAAAGLAFAFTGAAVTDAHASYFLSKGQAQTNARDAAEYKYAGNGVEANGSYCRPQFTVRRPGYDYHRWVCTWVGTDEDGADVYGTLRIDGHSDGTFGYTPLSGGLRWS
jgi:hypothetical protein